MVASRSARAGGRQPRGATPTCRAPRPAESPRRAGVLAGVVAGLLVLTGCAVGPSTVGLSEVLERPAERALWEGLRLYDEGQPLAAETALQRALQTGLASTRDRVLAHKLLAFVACAHERVPECEARFRAALALDPTLQLSRAEAGHPQWGPVFQRLQAAPAGSSRPPPPPAAR